MSIAVPQQHLSFFTWVVPLRPDTEKVTGTTSSTYVTLPVALKALQEVTVKALDEFEAAVREIECVEQVRAEISGTYMHIVTYVNNSTQEQRLQVYEAEKLLYAQHSVIDFEFDLVDRRDHPLVEAEIVGKHIRVVR